MEECGEEQPLDEVEERGDDDEFVEFQVDSSFDEWTASFLGRESLGCGRSEAAKEMIVESEGRPLDSAGEQLTEDSVESVGPHTTVSEETMRPTVTHPRDETDDRLLSETDEEINGRDLETDPAEVDTPRKGGKLGKVALADSNQDRPRDKDGGGDDPTHDCMGQGLDGGRGGHGLGTDESGTAPSGGGTAVELYSSSASQPASQLVQVEGRNVSTRKKGKQERVVFHDSNREVSGSQKTGDEELSQDAMVPELRDDRQGGGVLDVFVTAPSGGETEAAPATALHSSPTGQPASQPAKLRMTSKQHSHLVSCNVTLGKIAGAELSRGGGRDEPVEAHAIPEPSRGGGREDRAGTQAKKEVCVHSKDGTCTVHGPGAKWRWRPILPVSSQPVGPNGKVKKREYYWQCEVGSGGRNLLQSRISFKRNTDGGDKETMGYQV